MKQGLLSILELVWGVIVQGVFVLEPMVDIPKARTDNLNTKNFGDT